MVQSHGRFTLGNPRLERDGDTVYPILYRGREVGSYYPHQDEHDAYAYVDMGTTPGSEDIFDIRQEVVSLILNRLGQRVRNIDVETSRFS